MYVSPVLEWGLCHKSVAWADALFPSVSWKQFCMKHFFQVVHGNMVKSGNKKQIPQENKKKFNSGSNCFLQYKKPVFKRGVRGFILRQTNYFD